MRYEIEIRKRAEKDLASLPKADAQRVADALFLVIPIGGRTDGRYKKLASALPEYRLRIGVWRSCLKSWIAKSLFIEFFIGRRPIGRHMKAQIIEKHGKKEFAVIPYKDFLRLQEEVEDYHDLRDLRRAKLDPKIDGATAGSRCRNIRIKKEILTWHSDGHQPLMTCRAVRGMAVPAL